MIHALPELAVASVVISPVHTPRRTEHIDSDDLVLNITLSGGRIVRQRGREAVVGSGEAVLTTSADPGIAVIHSPSRAFSIRMPSRILKSMLGDLDACLLRPIPRDTEALRLLTSYAGVVKDAEALAVPELRGLLVAHFHDLVAMALGAIGAAAEVARGRGVRAARLRAIKADIAENLSDAGLGIDAVARRHGITPRYIRMLLESEGTTFSAFVIERRLARAHRMLRDPRYVGHAINAMAFECGFGDLSYFNRTFRKRYGVTPSDVRAAVRSGDGTSV